METKDIVNILFIIAGIVTVGSFLAFVIYPIYYDGGNKNDQPTPTTPTPTLSPTVTFTPTPRPSMNCFPEVSENRTKVMEAGTEDFLLIGPFESKDEPMVINFTEYKNPIGYIKLFFFPDNKLTKIEKVVDSKCQQIEEYSHIEDGSRDKHVLQAWDPIKIKFENNNYLLTVYYQADEIRAVFERTV